MSEKKDITINTSAFSLTIHWNPQVVGTQFSILFGVVLLKWITKSPNVNTLCTVVIVLDILSILISLFMGSSIGGETEEQKEPANAQKQPSQQSAPKEESTVEKGGKKNSKGSETESTARVTKRVPMPTQQGTRAPEPVREAAPEPQPAPKSQPEKKPAEEQSMENLSEQELSDLFNW